MNISLLDIAWPGRPYGNSGKPKIRIEQVKDTAIPDNLQTDSVVTAPADSVAGTHDAVADSLSQINMLNDLPVDGGGSSSLVWTVIVVVAALAVCVALAMAYRRHNSPSF